MSGRCGENTTKNKPCKIRVFPNQKCAYHENLNEYFQKRDAENEIDIHKRKQEAGELLRAIDRTDSITEKEKLRKLYRLALQQLVVMTSSDYVYSRLE
jgi:uncharacterized protein YpiB (UPF0302 family)